MAGPSAPLKSVSFDPYTQFENDCDTAPPKRCRRMTTDTFREFRSNTISDAVLVEAAQLFSEHYGIWNTPPGCPGGKPGTRVRLSPSRLRSQYFPAGARSSYVSVHVDDVLAGHVFACRWDYQGRQVCWVTQLVVHREYRRRRLATSLLAKVREPDDEIFGIMSSHPAACIALSKACSDVTLDNDSLLFMQSCAKEVMATSPITYVKDARLGGQIFDPHYNASKARPDSLIAGVDTQFYIDHDEPVRALAWIWDQGLPWPLGDLPEGHEFLLVFESSRRRRRPFLTDRASNNSGR